VNVVLAGNDRARLEAAHQVLPIDAPRTCVLDRLVRLAADLAQAPIALLTIVEQERQVFAAQCGLPEDLAAAGSTPLEYSICQHAVTRRRPLILSDTAMDPIFHDHPAVVSLGVVAYAGIPLITRDDHAIGTLCVIDVIPRDWAHDQLAQLALLADIVVDELELQDYVREAAFRQAWKGVPESSRW
jgi:GAF domain-containing protein